MNQDPAWTDCAVFSNCPQGKFACLFEIHYLALSSLAPKPSSDGEDDLIRPAKKCKDHKYPVVSSAFLFTYGPLRNSSVTFLLVDFPKWQLRCNSPGCSDDTQHFLLWEPWKRGDNKQEVMSAHAVLFSLHFFYFHNFLLSDLMWNHKLAPRRFPLCT